MTNKNLQKLLYDLNAGKGFPNFLINNIGGSVYFGKVWKNLYSDGISCLGEFYFIKEGLKYVGVVQYAGSDLHWLTLKTYRNKGYMSNALKQWILPHIFYFFNKNSQKITIKDEVYYGNIIDKDAVASRALARKIGFEFIGRNPECDRDEFEIVKDNINFNKVNFFKIERCDGMEDDQLMIKKTFSCRKSLEFVADIASYKYNVDVSKFVEAINSNIADIRFE